MKRIISLILILFITIIGSAQNNQNIDSLKNIISAIEKKCPKPCEADTGRINAYIKIGDVYMFRIPDSTVFYVNHAIKISEALLKTNPSKEVTDTTKKYLSVALNNLGYIYDDKGDIQKALDYYHESLQLSEDIDDKKGIAESLNNIGIIYNNQGNTAKAYDCYIKSLEIQKKIGNKQGIALSCNNLGFLHFNKGDIPKALEYFSTSIKLREEIGDKKGTASSFNNMGFVYYHQDDFPKALEYFEKALKIREEIDDKIGMALSYNNIGGIYKNQGDMDKVLEYLHKSLKIQEEIDDKNGIAMSYNNIGFVYNNMDETDKAKEYFNKALKIREEIGDKQAIAQTLYNLCLVSISKKDLSSLKEYATRGYNLSKELGFPDDIEKAASQMKELSIMQGDYKKAFEYYQEQIAMRDSIKNDENYKLTQKQQARYEFEKQAAIDSIAHAKEIQIKDLDIARVEGEKKAQAAQRNMFIVGFGLMVILAFFIFRSYKQKQKANILLGKQKNEIEEKNEELNQQNEEISAQRDEIEAQRDKVIEQKEIIEEIHKGISQSIDYAKRIQTSILPDVKIFKQYFNEHFVLFKPRDVVSGDFYWATQVDDWIVVTVADCTGHGVPGAFMSMLGISYLNEIVRKKEVVNAALVLNHLRTSVIDALKQSGEGSQKDGMDMSILAINIANSRAFWAGANNPIWIIREQNMYNDIEDKKDLIEEIKPDRMPVAVHVFMDDFTNHEIKLNKGDKIYLFSDGYPDQFGGKKGRKFMHENLKRLIAETSILPMNQQHETLEKALNEWINWNGEKYKQVDDITILGIKI